MEYIIPSIQEFFHTLDSHNGLVTVLGWWTVFLLGIWAAKIQQRNSARLEIFKDLNKLKSEIDKSSIDLGVLLSKFSLPFLTMEWAEKGSIGLGEGKRPGELWLENNRKILDALSLFEEKNQNFLNAANTWISIMPRLKTSRNILAAEFSGLSRTLWAYVQFHMSQTTNEYDWKKWDRKQIEAETERVRAEFNKVAIGFLNDFMDLLHDELIRPIFAINKVRREDFNYVQPMEAETLTEKGIKVIKYQTTEIAMLFKQKREKPTEPKQE